MPALPICSVRPTLYGSAECALPNLGVDTRRLDLLVGPSELPIFTRSVRSSISTCLVEGASDRRLRSPVHSDFASVDDALQAHLSPDGPTFDIIHAHYTLATALDPVACLAAMRDACRPGGLVAVREVDVNGMLCNPDPDERSWVPLAMRSQVARQIARHPDAARKLPSWAADAGFGEVRTTVSVMAVSESAGRQRLASRWVAALGAVLPGRSTWAEERTAWERWSSTEGAFALLPVAESLCWT